MSNQTSNNWNERYNNNDTPWDDTNPWHEIANVFSRWVKPSSLVLDIGCGTGEESRAIAKLGYNVTGIDLSKTAIEKAKGRDNPPNCSFECKNILEEQFEVCYSTAFDRGCFHTFIDLEGRTKFAKAVATCLPPGGIWINVSGSCDTPVLSKDHAPKHPRRSLSEIIYAVEPLFTVKEVSVKKYGEKPGVTDFEAFVSVFVKR